MASPLRMNGWLSYPWAEHITKSGVTREGAFSYEGGCQAGMVIRVNWTDTVPVIQEILGAAKYNRTTGQLDRILPVRHPEFDWLYASRISSVRPLRWDSKVRLSGGTCSGYQFSVITIIFTHPKWVMLSDNDVDRIYGSPREEWRRFVERRPEPSGEIFTRTEGAFKWEAGPLAGQTFKGPQGVFLPKATEVLVWKRVPQVGLFSNGGTGKATNVLASVGTVNADEFLGYPAGTLLLQPPRFIPLEVPTIPAAVGANENIGQPAIFYDVELPILHFDPPPGTAVRGHNLAAHTDGLWYPIIDASTGTKRIFAASYFEDIFEMVA